MTCGLLLASYGAPPAFLQMPVPATIHWEAAAAAADAGCCAPAPPSIVSTAAAAATNAAETMMVDATAAIAGTRYMRVVLGARAAVTL